MCPRPIPEWTTRELYPLGDPPDYEPAPPTSLASVAFARGVEPSEVAYDMLLEDGGRNFLFAPFANYADFNLDACGEMLAHSETVVGLGTAALTWAPSLTQAFPLSCCPTGVATGPPGDLTSGG